MLDVDVGVLGGERVQPRGRLVGRAVVDEDQLVGLGRERLAEERAEAVVDVAARVEDRDHDGDPRGGHYEAGWTAGAASYPQAAQSSSSDGWMSAAGGGGSAVWIAPDLIFAFQSPSPGFRRPWS